MADLRRPEDLNPEQMELWEKIVRVTVGLLVAGRWLTRNYEQVEILACSLVGWSTRAREAGLTHDEIHSAYLTGTLNGLGLISAAEYKGVGLQLDAFTPGEAAPEHTEQSEPVSTPIPAAFEQFLRGLDAP